MSVQLEFVDGRESSGNGVTYGERLDPGSLRVPVEGETVAFGPDMEGFPTGTFTVTWVEFHFDSRRRLARVGIV